MAISISPTLADVQQTLRNIFGVVTNIETKHILTGKANIPARKSLYGTLIFMHGEIVGRVQEEYNNNENSDTTGMFKRTVRSHRKEKYSVQFYHDGAHATGMALNAFLNDPMQSAQIFLDEGITLTEISRVRNINDIVSAEWEERAEMDFCVNFISTIENDTVPYVQGFNIDEDGNILSLTQSILIKYIDEIYTYDINSLDRVFRIVDENNGFVFPTLSGSFPERIVTYDNFIYTRMIRLPHVAVIDFTALPNDDETDENILFVQTIEGEGTTENDNLHRFSHVNLFTYPEDRIPQFTITQIVTQIEDIIFTTSFTIHCENDFDIGALFDEWATDDPRPVEPDEPAEPVEPVEPDTIDYPVDADYQTALAEYQTSLAEYQVALDDYQIALDEYQVALDDYQIALDAFNMPDIPLPRGNFAAGAVGDDAYQAQLDLYNNAINNIVSFRKYVFYNRYALYIVNLTTEKFVSLKANVFDDSNENFVTFNSSNWEVLDHNITSILRSDPAYPASSAGDDDYLRDISEVAVPDMLNSLNGDRVIVGLLRLNLFKAFGV